MSKEEFLHATLWVGLLRQILMMSSPTINVGLVDLAWGHGRFRKLCLECLTNE